VTASTNTLALPTAHAYAAAAFDDGLWCLDTPETSQPQQAITKSIRHHACTPTLCAPTTKKKQGTAHLEGLDLLSCDQGWQISTHHLLGCRHGRSSRHGLNRRCCCRYCCRIHMHAKVPRPRTTARASMSRRLGTCICTGFDARVRLQEGTDILTGAMETDVPCCLLDWRGHMSSHPALSLQYRVDMSALRPRATLVQQNSWSRG
jgi:hypothetical protein